MGVKLFGPQYQKANPDAKNGRINRLAYIPVLTLYGDKRKSSLAMAEEPREA